MESARNIWRSLDDPKPEPVGQAYLLKREIEVRDARFTSARASRKRHSNGLLGVILRLRHIRCNLQESKPRRLDPRSALSQQAAVKGDEPVEAQIHAQDIDERAVECRFLALQNQEAIRRVWWPKSKRKETGRERWSEQSGLTPSCEAGARNMATGPTSG